MKAIKDTKNELLSRREVKLLVENSGNPGFAKAQEIIAGHFKADSANIAVKSLKSKFGRDTFLIDAFIYNSAEDKARIEPKPKVKKAKGGAA